MTTPRRDIPLYTTVIVLSSYLITYVVFRINGLFFLQSYEGHWVHIRSSGSVLFDYFYFPLRMVESCALSAYKYLWLTGA
jgi:hypothetical protein